MVGQGRALPEGEGTDLVVLAGLQPHQGLLPIDRVDAAGAVLQVTLVHAYPIRAKEQVRSLMVPLVIDLP